MSLQKGWIAIVLPLQNCVYAIRGFSLSETLRHIRQHRGTITSQRFIPTAAIFSLLTTLLPRKKRGQHTVVLLD